MTPRMEFLSFAFLSSTLLFGCSKPVGPSDIPGVYEAMLPTGSETLDLKPDGEYTQRFKGKQGVELTATGKWDFEPYGGEPKVAIHDFSSHFPNSSPNKMDVFLLGADRSRGRIVSTSATTSMNTIQRNPTSRSGWSRHCCRVAHPFSAVAEKVCGTVGRSVLSFLNWSSISGPPISAPD